MKKIVFTTFFIMFLWTSGCFAIDFKELGQSVLKDILQETFDIKLDTITNYLNWEVINISFSAEMQNTTDVLGQKAEVDSTVYKRGLSGIRLNVKGAITLQDKQPPVKLADFYMLRYPLKKEAWIVLPGKKTYMELDPARSREILGELQEKLDDRSTKVEKKEKLGKEKIGAYLCEKVHVLMTLANGTKSDNIAWLAEDLKGFPLKIISRNTTPGGMTVLNTTTFSNIKKEVPDNSLFEIPKGYIKCKNIIELATGGKFGKRLKKRSRKARLLKKK